MIIAKRLPLRRFVLALCRERRGATAVLFALIMPALIGTVGLGVETGLWYQAKRHLQTATDAAAVGGALQRATGDLSGVRAVAVHDAGQNGFVVGARAAIDVHNPPASGPQAGNPAAVEVIATQQQPRLLSALLVARDPVVAARAVALIKVSGDACVLSLSRTAAIGVAATGSSLVNMAGCVVASNSTSATAINIGGSSSLTAESLWTAGGYYFGGSAALDLTRPAQTHAWALADPFSDTQIALPSGCDVNNAKYSGSVTLSPGTYCNGLSFGSNAVATLNPGTYYINSGDISINAQATVTCACSATGSGVTFVLTSSTGQTGSVTINGGANVTLSAPTGADALYPGLLFVQDNRAALGNVNKLNGGSTMHLHGGVYMPRGNVTWTGDASQDGSGCVQIVSDTVNFSGNSAIDNSGCAALGLKPVTITGVELVE